MHPIVCFGYFALVLGFTMFFTHPVTQLVSLVSAMVYSNYLKSTRILNKKSWYTLFVIALVSIMNPLFNHEGATILTYLRDGNPLTLESITYGISSGAMLCSTIIWFSCFNVVITSDKLVYLFGRIVPALSLVLSMTLRFIPRFKAQMNVVSDAQRGVGRDAATGGVWSRIKHGVQIMSILITWALEGAIETADSMKSRGYGLPGRTAFSNFRFDGRDRAVLVTIVMLGGYIWVGSITGLLGFRYFPTMRGTAPGFGSVSVIICHAVLCALPMVLNYKEDMVWRALKYGS